MKLPACAVFILSLGLFLLSSVDGTAASTKPASVQEPAGKPSSLDIGMIFNSTIFPFDIESYQSGFGMKFGRNSLYIRSLLDLVLNGTSDSLGVTLGTTAEYHLTPEPISFYMGGTANAGYLYQAAAYTTYVLSVGVIAGVEYFPTKFISLFAEYAITSDLTWTTDLATSQTTFDYLIDTRMGNDSKIGIVIHLLRPTRK